MSRFNLKDYEEVKDRLPKWLKAFPNGRVITEMVSEFTK